MKKLCMALSILCTLNTTVFARSSNIIIIEQLEPKILIPPNNMIDESTILNIISSLNHHHFLDTPTTHFASSCFSIKALGDDVKGVHTGQLFAIKIAVSCLNVPAPATAEMFLPLYILKQTIKGRDEIDNLNRVSASILGTKKIPTKDLLSTYYKSSFESAIITFEEACFQIGQGKDKKYFTLLQTAHGKSLLSYIKKFALITRDSHTTFEEKMRSFNTLKKAFYQVGFASSKLHQEFNQSRKMLGHTFIHGDFHAQNIFYDEHTSNVYLIDNETFAMSLNHKSKGLIDIADLYILHSVHTIAHAFAKHLVTNTDLGINDTIWHALWKELFKGYLLAFDQLSTTQQMSLLRAFEKKFYKSISQRYLFSHARNILDQRKLKLLGSSSRRNELKHAYLNDVFSSIRAELMQIMAMQGT